jgi:transcriptional regulator with XRE-family HTH domain
VGNTVDEPSGGENELPERRVTANMVVGYNLAWFRRAAGVTQEELGEPLGWTKVTVSAAERSWDGKRVRKFDADELLRIAGLFGIPIAALFLPPEDDGETVRYVIDGGGQDGQNTMRMLLEYAMSDPVENGNRVMQAYEDRLVSAMNTYLDSQAVEAVATRLKERAIEQQLARVLRQARHSREALASFAEAYAGLYEDNELLQKLLVTMLRATPEGETLLEKEDAGLTLEQRRRAWDDLEASSQEWQAKVALVSRELYGERGPANAEEFNKLINEAQRRGYAGPDAARLPRRHDGTYELFKPPEADEQETNGDL